MKKYWIVTALLVLFCAAVPVLASEALPELEEQVRDILVRLEKVEAYEERIATLESQIATLITPTPEPTIVQSEDALVMSELEYWAWLEKEMLRAGIRIEKIAPLFDSNDPADIIPALAAALEMLFDFHDEHSRIVTTAAEYEEFQSVLDCLVEELEPLRGIEEKTVGEAFAALTPLFMAMMEDPDELFRACDLDELQEFGELFFD